ncbi:MAG: hypothetical protein GXO65_04995 [Euryarchaeota archaeon]|nr:hypothetical protein [Euryarchaeota archaeon]
MKRYKKRGRGKSEEGRNRPILLLLVGVMVFGTLAYGFLFSGRWSSGQTEAPETLAPEPPPEVGVSNITLRHNPVNTTISQVIGGQMRQVSITYNDTHIIMDLNHPLAGKTLYFNITLLNLTKGNGTAGTVEVGDRVEVEYTGYLQDGEVFDSNQGGPALEFVVGGGEMIDGFNDAVVGMAVNQTKTAVIPPEKAYGPHDPAGVEAIPIVEVIPKRMVIDFPMFFEIPAARFTAMFGTQATPGEVVSVSELNARAQVISAGENVTLQTLLKPGDTWQHPSFPWNSTILWVLGNQLELEHQVEVGKTYQFPGLPWNTTVVAVG